MKIYKLPQLSDNPENEYCLGPEELGSSVYLTYGRLRPKETAKKVSPAEGGEEIICVLKGSIRVKSGKTSFSVTAGEAFHSKEAQAFLFDNLTDEEAIYIAAGGASFRSKALAKPEPQAVKAETHIVEPKMAMEEDEFEITSDDSPDEEDKGEGA